MPINIPNDLPAKAILNSEQVFVMTEDRSLHQDIRPLNLLFLNLMPIKINTEVQYLRKLLPNRQKHTILQLIWQKIAVFMFGITVLFH